MSFPAKLVIASSRHVLIYLACIYMIILFFFSVDPFSNKSGFKTIGIGNFTEENHCVILHMRRKAAKT